MRGPTECLWAGPAGSFEAARTGQRMELVRNRLLMLKRFGLIFFVLIALLW